MKVGVFIADNEPQRGGAVTFNGSIVNALSKSNSQHEFYIFYYGKEKECTPGGSKTVFYIPLPNPQKKAGRLLTSWIKSKHLKTIKNLVKKGLTSVNPISPLQAAVTTYNIDLMWFIYGYEKVSIPFIYTVLDLEHRKHPFFPEISLSGNTWEARENIYSNIIPKATYIITGTTEGKKEIQYFYRLIDDRITVIPFPTPAYAFNDHDSTIDVEKKHHLSFPYLFYPAQFWPHKNHANLLQALHTLKHKYNLDFSLVLTGSDKGNLDYVKEKTKELELSDNVHFLGFVSETELISLYKNAFALIFLSFFGPDNIPPLEAFGLRCPVIAADISGAKDFLGDAALFTDPSDPDHIAQTIKELYDSEKLRKTLVSRGTKRANSWTADDYVKKIDTLINNFEPYRRCWSSKSQYIHS